MKTISALLYSAAALALMSTGSSSVQAYSESFDLLDHTNLFSYYRPANTNLTAEQVALPAQCSVDQVHIVGRHATRYPSTNSYNGLKRIGDKVQQKLQANVSILAPELEFLKTWNLDEMITDPAHQIENLTALGLTEAYDFGASVRKKYAHLYQQDATVWSGSVERVQLTAKSFMQGLFGQEAVENHYANLITSNSSDKTIAANTLTPIDTCTNFPKGLGSPQQSAFQNTWVPQALARLEKLWPGFEFIADDLMGMMDLCVYEMALRSKSERRFCKIFTDDEWQSYDYFRDLSYYYDSGYGNPRARTAAYPYVAAVARLLAQPKTASCQKIYAAFSHDTQLSIFLTAFGVNEDATPLSSSAVNLARKTRASRSLLMGARLVTERINCGSEGSFVRLTVNDAVVPFDDCKDGPGLSCSLEKYLIRLKSIEAKAGDFMTQCGVAAAPGLSSVNTLFENPARNLCSSN
uniref:Acid phosphatase n=1 Tax=Globisporangium ultimum (strain ATCC 200006 / CBS 805.95 / DAOM BR144) TaxID=431595 RepID=K3W7E0_GLOUD